MDDDWREGNFTFTDANGQTWTGRARFQLPEQVGLRRVFHIDEDDSTWETAEFHHEDGTVTVLDDN